VDLRGLSARFSLFDKQTGLLDGRLGFRRSKPFNVNKRVYERDLKLDLLATQPGSAGQDRKQCKGTRELLSSFNQRRSLQRPLSCFAPQTGGLVDQAGLRAVARKKLRLVLSDFRKLALECFDDPGMKRASRLTQ